MAKLKYTKEFLEPIIQNSISVAEVMRKLGLKQSGSLHSYITSRIKILNIDNSHFRGQASNYGENHKGGPTPLKLETVFVNDRLSGRREKAATLKKYLIQYGIEYRCSANGCKVESDWNGNQITLHIDHIDGNGLNNVLENLRFLCPNCHSQTSNYGAKNIKGF